MKTKVISIILIVCLANNALAFRKEKYEQEKKNNPWGMNIELGISSFGGVIGLGGFYQIENFLIIPQYQYSENHKGNPNRYVETYALMLGYTTRKRNIPRDPITGRSKVLPVVSVSTGLGAMIYTTHGQVINDNVGFLWDPEDDYKVYKHQTYCWKFECEFLLSNKNFAIGFVPYVNLNFHRDVYGLKFRWQLGRLQ